MPHCIKFPITLFVLIYMKLKTLLLVLLLSTSFIGISYADYQDGLDAYGKGDYKTAIKEWKPLAKKGSATAQFNLSNMYSSGRGILRDDIKAEKWMRKAAEQGDAHSQFLLGWMYEDNSFILRDLSEAKYWINKAYENPNADAMTVRLAKDNWESYELWKY